MAKETMITPAAVKKLERFARAGGVKMVKVTSKQFLDARRREREEDDYGFFRAPFAFRELGINWSKKILEYVEGVHVSGIVHELGHLLACKDSPPRSIEWNFFGWEMLLFKRIDPVNGVKCFREGNKDYSVDYGLNFSEMHHLGDKEFKAMMRERVSFAKEIGIVDSHGIPLMVR